jgi:predicted Rdx family selenoprotein
VADLLKRELNLAEVALLPGDRGEFTVQVGDEIVSRKNRLGFPEDGQILAAVRKALEV